MMPYRYKVTVHFGDKIIQHSADSVTPPEEYIRMLRTTVIINKADLISLFETRSGVQLMNRRDGKRYVTEAM